MNYYDIEFGYYPCPTVNCPGPDEQSWEASAANMAADKLVEEAAKQHGIEMMHAYSWPDGSLYKHIRDAAGRSLEEIKAIFTIEQELTRPSKPKRLSEDADADGDNPEDGDGDPEKMTMTISPSIREMPLERAQRIQGGSAFFITLEERFELAAKYGGDGEENRRDHNTAMTAIHDKREAELQAISDYTAYDRARDACPICKPGKMACEDCGKLSQLSWATRTEFLEQHRPMQPSP